MRPVGRPFVHIWMLMAARSRTRRAKIRAALARGGPRVPKIPRPVGVRMLSKSREKYNRTMKLRAQKGRTLFPHAVMGSKR